MLKLFRKIQHGPCFSSRDRVEREGVSFNTWKAPGVFIETNEDTNPTRQFWCCALVTTNLDAPRLGRGEFHHQPRESESKIARCRRVHPGGVSPSTLGHTVREKVSLPPDKPGGIPGLLHNYSRQKVNLRRDEPGGIHKAQHQNAPARESWIGLVRTATNRSKGRKSSIKVVVECVLCA